MSQADSSYVAWVSARIVRMFQRYVQNINPEDERFLTFITKYLAEKNVKDPKALPYSELYKLIKEGIREYLRRQEPTARSDKRET